MTDILTVLNPVTAVPASGAAQVLAGNASIDPVYDIILTGNCALTLQAASAQRLQTITVVLRQDANGGRVASLPLAAWPNGASPQLNTSAGFYDVLQFATINGQDWIGSAIGLGVKQPGVPAKPTITVTPGNAGATISIVDGAANGSPITSHTVLRNGSQVYSGSSATFNDSGLTNGTTYTYTATATNSAGTSAVSAAVTGKPTNVTTPVHYLSLPGGGNGASGTGGSSSNSISNGVFEFYLYLSPDTYSYPAAIPLIQQWDDNHRNYIVELGAGGGIDVVSLGASGSYDGSGTTTASLASAGFGSAGGWLHIVANYSSQAYGSYAGGTYTVETAPSDGTTNIPAASDFTRLGDVLTGLATTARTTDTASSIYIGAGAGSGGTSFKGKVFRAVYRNATTTLIDVDFTKAAPGATSLTAAAGGDFAVFSPASVA